MKVCVVCSQGGHLTETLEVLDAFEGHEIFFATYHNMREAELREKYKVYSTKFTGIGPFSVLRYCFWALYILLKERPSLIFSTGAEIALPFFYFGKILGMKLIYLEDWCNIYQLSKTGRLVYRISNVFYVQWPQLLEICDDKAKYEGAVI